MINLKKFVFPLKKLYFEDKRDNKKNKKQKSWRTAFILEIGGTFFLHLPVNE